MSSSEAWSEEVSSALIKWLCLESDCLGLDPVSPIYRWCDCGLVNSSHCSLVASSAVVKVVTRIEWSNPLEEFITISGIEWVLHALRILISSSSDLNLVKGGENTGTKKHPEIILLDLSVWLLAPMLLP